MFKNIRKCLDEYEKWEEGYFNSINKHQSGTVVKYLDMETSDFFELHLAKALMKDCDAAKIAKIILASKGISNEIKVKVE